MPRCPAAVPKRLRPTAPICADAVLVGDPGRALLLAQELLEAPKMSNHARGLWGYSGSTPEGGELTIQATGMGGPSAAIVLGELVELGVRRAVRVGTCVGLDPAHKSGELLCASEAVANGEVVLPDPALSARLQRKLAAGGRGARILSLDRPPIPATPAPGLDAADLQTATVLGSAASLGIAAAAILIVEETARGERISDPALERAAKRAGRAAVSALSG
jgi:uridine phosphorylase